MNDGNGTGIKKNRKCKGNMERKGNEEERSRPLRNGKSAMKGHKKS